MAQLLARVFDACKRVARFKRAETGHSFGNERQLEKYVLLMFLIISISFFSCNRDDVPEPYHPTPYQISIPKFFPSELNIPDDNPMTVEGVELGRYLFYDGRLSGRTNPDSLMSCSTCHLQENSFECGINHPVFVNGHPHGITGTPTPHVMLPLINLVWNNTGYLWNGLVSKDNPQPDFRTLEDIVRMGIVAKHEMDSDTTRVKAMFQNLPGYPELFKKAFGSEVVTFDRISKAIAQFIRTLISSGSKFDRYMRGEEQLTEPELSGYVLFTTEYGGDCFHCHGGSGNPLFTTNLFYNNGKDSIFTGPHEDTRDRYHVTGNTADMGAYKATTLRNIALTGPYMHDGRFATLDEVINFYSDSVVWSPYINPLMHHVSTGGARLTPAEKADLKAFLLTLTDNSFLSNPDFSRPDVFPDGTHQ
ncbi:MAG: cytochrome-c peroxidase [Bacteroidetes bacterium]|nr:cytochrome-c peroxidase [Bacteroidota bacterium]